ncbi:MAG: putative glycosyltransferase [Sphingomonas bacterium]|nr:putative glycosyltransferase [Sphingomonas bacterium]
MRIALVSDAWAPQVNGVVRTLMTTVERLCALGHAVETITPDGFETVSCPTYPEIRLALLAGPALGKRLAAFDPEAVHIATEGPLGWAARRWCLDRGMPFTTSFHTRFPEYLAMRTRLPADWFWPPVRRFHAPAVAIFAATPTLDAELRSRGLPHTHRWSRGVDTALFTPDGAPLSEYRDLPGPILLHVGRVAVEKNIEAFFALDVPGTKVVVGEGPALARLRTLYPQVHFLGKLEGQRLAAAYRGADLLVFPSRTDTFGLVMIEALACGTPVAAFPVPGPLDILTPDVGIMADELADAVRRALPLDRRRCAEAGRCYSWATCSAQFLAGLAPRRMRVAA